MGLLGDRFSASEYLANIGLMNSYDFCKVNMDRINDNSRKINRLSFDNSGYTRFRM